MNKENNKKNNEEIIELFRGVGHVCLYAKNFYSHGSNLFEDLKKVCAMDDPERKFETEDDVAEFMKECFIKIYGEDTYEGMSATSSKYLEGFDARVVPILCVYSIIVPMDRISARPDFDKIPPEYDTVFGSLITFPFGRNMDNDTASEMADGILSWTASDIKEMLLEKMCVSYDFKKASRMLETFGEHVTEKELRDDLESIPQRHGISDHFIVEFNPMTRELYASLVTNVHKSDIRTKDDISEMISEVKSKESSIFEKTVHTPTEIKGWFQGYGDNMMAIDVPDEPCMYDNRTNIGYGFLTEYSKDDVKDCMTARVMMVLEVSEEIAGNTLIYVGDMEGRVL